MKDVLVLQAARFGDLLQTKRLILSLERKYTVHLCVDDSLVPLAKIVYPAAIVHGMPFHWKDARPEPADVSQRLENLREINFSRILNCNYSPLTVDICRIFEDDRVIGYRPARDTAGGIMRSPWARLAFRMSRERAATSLNLVDFWGWMDNWRQSLRGDAPVAATHVNPPARPEGKGIGIALSGRQPRRSLPMDVLAPFVNTLFMLMGKPRIKLFGSATEAGAAKRLLRQSPPEIQANTLDLAGKTDWTKLVDEMRGLDLLLTPDTGLMHLGAHLGVPVMAFFLSSAWCHETGPYGIGHIVWQAVCPVAPCLESAACSNEMRCLQPYKNTAFLRCLAGAAKGDFSRLAHMPADLQCWQTGFDEFGAILSLKGGNDEYAAKRKVARELIASWINPEKFSALSPETRGPRAQIIANELFPAGEWMLPPWRYC